LIWATLRKYIDYSELVTLSPIDAMLEAGHYFNQEICESYQKAFQNYIQLMQIAIHSKGQNKPDLPKKPRYFEPKFEIIENNHWVETRLAGQTLKITSKNV